MISNKDTPHSPETKKIILEEVTKAYTNVNRLNLDENQKTAVSIFEAKVIPLLNGSSHVSDDVARNMPLEVIDLSTELLQIFEHANGKANNCEVTSSMLARSVMACLDREKEEVESEPADIPKENSHEPIDPDLLAEDQTEELESDEDESIQAEAEKEKIQEIFEAQDNAYQIAEAVKKEVIEPALKAIDEADDAEEKQTLIEILKEIIKEIREEMKKAKKDPNRFNNVNDDLDQIARTALEPIVFSAVKEGATNETAVGFDKRRQNDSFRGSISAGYTVAELEAATFEALAETIKTEDASESHPVASLENSTLNIFKDLIDNIPKPDGSEASKHSWLVGLFTALKVQRKRIKNSATWQKPADEDGVEDIVFAKAQELSEQLGLDTTLIEASLHNIRYGGDDAIKSGASTLLEAAKSKTDPVSTDSFSSDTADDRSDYDSAKSTNGEAAPEAKEAGLSVDFKLGLFGRRRAFHINVDSDAFHCLTQEPESYQPELLKLQTEFFYAASRAGLGKKVDVIKKQLVEKGWADQTLVKALIKEAKNKDLKLNSSDYENRIIPASLLTEVK